ncbi:hypothetical protein E4T47_08119 [Aureobasidium subglaciale]|nr:hypothetical protein E4T47_08119 [Aureobasidium subglaciale]
MTFSTPRSCLMKKYIATCLPQPHQKVSFAPWGRHTGIYIVLFDVVVAEKFYQASKRPNWRFLSGAWHYARL